MNHWGKRIRDAALLGLGWAVVWAPVAVLLGVFVIDPDNSMDEMWGVIGAYPGFLSGMLFSALRGLGEGRRGLAELSLPRAGVWAVLSGVLVGALPFAPGNAESRQPAVAGSRRRRLDNSAERALGGRSGVAG